MSATHKASVYGLLVDDPANRPASFDRELEACLPALRRRARKLCTSDPAGADDLVNDTVVYMLRRWTAWRPAEAPMAVWASWCMRSAYRDRGRRFARRVRLEDTEARTADKPADDGETGRVATPFVESSAENVIYLKQAMQALANVKHADTLYRYAQGETMDEIAAEGGVTRQAVFHKINAARLDMAKAGRFRRGVDGIAA